MIPSVNNWSICGDTEPLLPALFTQPTVDPISAKTAQASRKLVCMSLKSRMTTFSGGPSETLRSLTLIFGVLAVKLCLWTFQRASNALNMLYTRSALSPFRTISCCNSWEYIRPVVKICLDLHLMVA